jgi:heme/copper-type cytochrome/quinol oxidase subunit 4
VLTQSARALAGAWVALAVITLVSFSWAELSHSGTDLVATIVMAAAAVKGRIILVWFMNMRSFPLRWRCFFDGWLLIVTVAIVGLHLAGHP